MRLNASLRYIYTPGVFDIDQLMLISIRLEQFSV